MGRKESIIGESAIRTQGPKGLAFIWINLNARCQTATLKSTSKAETTTKSTWKSITKNISAICVCWTVRFWPTSKKSTRNSSSIFISKKGISTRRTIWFLCTQNALFVKSNFSTKTILRPIWKKITKSAFCAVSKNIDIFTIEITKVSKSTWNCLIMLVRIRIAYKRDLLLFAPNTNSITIMLMCIKKES